jgi:hypothetical protein
MPRICSSVVFWFIKCGRISFTPSCSTGSVEVQNGGFAENQTALAKVQWMNKWESFSAMLQVEHSLLILFEYLPALSPGARVLLINLQHKVLMHGGSCLCFHVLVKMYMACGVMLLDPFWGSWTRKLLLRSLKASCRCRYLICRPPPKNVSKIWGNNLNLRNFLTRLVTEDEKWDRYSRTDSECI